MGLSPSTHGGREGGSKAERDGPECQTQLKALRDREGGEVRGARSGIWTGGAVGREGRERSHPQGREAAQMSHGWSGAALLGVPIFG